MDWNLETREVSMSVRELAGFSLQPEPLSSRFGLRERAELGTLWHETLQKRAEEDETVQASFEISTQGSLHSGKWKFRLRGRIDQCLRQEGQVTLREVKSIRQNLPMEADALRERYPDYFHQAAIYYQLTKPEALMSKDALVADLLFVDYQEGITQIVPIEEHDLQRLKDHLLEVSAFLENKRSRLKQLRNFSFGQPFETWREGQAPAREKLQEAFDEHHRLLFQAPTGFGKSGLALELALKKLKAGEVSKVLLLTSKTTGQMPLQAQLERMGIRGSKLRYFTLYNRETLDQGFIDAEPSSAKDQLNRWKALGLSIEDLFDSGTVSLEELRRLGRETGIAPSTISRFLLPHSEIWIGDFNYLFDLGVRDSFLEFSSIQNDQTFLIIDEAHNLPSRVEHSFSWNLDAENLNEILTEAYYLRFPGNFIREIDRLTTFLRNLSICERLKPTDEEDLLHFLKEIRDAWENAHASRDELSEKAIEFLWQLPRFIASLQSSRPSLCHIPKKGSFEYHCLDCSDWISEVILPFRYSLLMSATLHPMETFLRKTGLQKNKVAQLMSEAPWQEHAFEVIADARIDTRYKARERSVHQTASALSDLQPHAEGPLLVFFSSFRYAETIREILLFEDPLLRIFVQPRVVSTEKQSSMLESALEGSDMIFLVMGSRFSEGIDQLGGRISLAVVIGPALPEVNAVQKARMEHFPSSQSKAFREVYLIPAIRKINQALGRLVRAPEHRATVILQCQRFALPETLDLLNPNCQPSQIFYKDEDFNNWLLER